MNLLKDLLNEEDYMQYQMNKKLGKNVLNRQTKADVAKQQTQPGQAQTEPQQQVPQQAAASQMGGQGDMDGMDGGDMQAANDSAKQAVKLLRQSAQALAPQKFDGDTAKAMTYILGRIQDYFDSKKF